MSKHIVVSLLFLICVLTALPSRVFATTSTDSPIVQEAEKQENSPPLETPINTASEYALPYPGILPDHPLYFIKQLRDSILDILIADPFKKIEFQILQADKKLGMALALNGKGKVPNAQAILKEGEKSLELAGQSAVRLKSEGKEVPGHVMERLVNASEKHGQVLDDVKSQNNDNFPFAESLDSVRKLQLELSNIQ